MGGIWLLLMRSDSHKRENADIFPADDKFLNVISELKNFIISSVVGSISGISVAWKIHVYYNFDYFIMYFEYIYL